MQSNSPILVSERQIFGSPVTQSGGARVSRSTTPSRIFDAALDTGAGQQWEDFAWLILAMTTVAVLILSLGLQ